MNPILRGFVSSRESLVVALGVGLVAIACGGAKREMEKVCDAEARSGATVAGDRAKVLAWIDANAGGDARKIADEAFAKSPSEASVTLRAASAKNGVASCALADALGHEESPPPSPRPMARPPSAIPFAADPNGEITSPKMPPAPSNQAKVEATGGLTPEAAATAVESSKIQLRLCYETARTKQPRLMGRVKLAMDIGPAGAPLGVKDVGSTIDAAVVTCMRGILTKTTFPPPSGGRANVTVSYDLMPDD